MLTQTQFDKWIEALESGKYKQGIGRLRDNNEKFCCLGVLADTIDSTNWEKFGTKRCAWANLDWFLPYDILEEDLQKPLTQLNDSPNGNTFKEIARYLKDNKQDYVE